MGIARQSIPNQRSTLITRSLAIRYREYARCLPDYLADLAADAYARRNARIARIPAQDGHAALPGVLFQMGLSNSGKSYLLLYRRCCQGLMQFGHVGQT